MSRVDKWPETVAAKAEVVEQVPEPVVEVLPYTIGIWNGMPNYQCKQCQYDTVEADWELRIAEHVMRVHTIPNSQGFREA